MAPELPEVPVWSWHAQNQVSRNDLSPTSIQKSGSAGHSSVVGDGGYAKQLAHSTAATNQSSHDREGNLAPEDEIQHVGGGVVSQDEIDEPMDGRPMEAVPERGLSQGLEYRLRKAMKQSAGREAIETRFVPIDEINTILDPRSVLRELQTLNLGGAHDLGALAHQICSVHEGKSPLDGKETKTTRRRIFATLVLMEAGRSIVEVLREGLYDWDLPLVLPVDSTDPVHSRLAKRDADGSLHTVSFSKEWTPYRQSAFLSCQWQLSSPVFEMRTQVGSKIMHYRLHPHSILPITEIEGEERKGGFSSVSKIKLHPAHRKSMAKDQDPDSWLALKRLRFGTEDEFRAEVGPLKRLGDNENPHIIQLLTTFHHQDEYNLVFQWADGGNLFDFWKAFPKPHHPPRDQGLCNWLATQLTGLASALSLIHECPLDPRAANMSGFNSRDARQKYGTHGDLKPENILWFKASPSNGKAESLGTFKISDFGLTSFHGVESRQMFVPQGISATYRAPEFDLDHHISQKYDMWSLGCVLTELLTWFLLGYDGVSAFCTTRLQEFQPKFKEDSFFSLTQDPMFPLGGATSKRCVKQHFNELRSQPNCSEFISEVIDFVQDKLLRMDFRKRCEVSEFLRFAEKVSKKCARDKAYCTERLQPIVKRRTDLSEIHARLTIESPNGKRGSLGPFSGSSMRVQVDTRTTLETQTRTTVSPVEEDGRADAKAFTSEDQTETKAAVVDSPSEPEEAPTDVDHECDNTTEGEIPNSATPIIQASANPNQFLQAPGFSNTKVPGKYPVSSTEGSRQPSFEGKADSAVPSQVEQQHQDFISEDNSDHGCFGWRILAWAKIGRRWARVRKRNDFEKFK